ncbi:MAG: peptide ABC transporter substrate-binding protein [Dehalococcoidia bacterium]|nr:peptide ABC transporter substrate-binding protein [Dehalococcoidia bacterium]
MPKFLALIALLVVGLASLSLTPGLVSPQDGAVSGLYRNTTEGFSVTLPEGWVGEEREDSRPLLLISAPSVNSGVGGQLWMFRSSEDTSAEEWGNGQIANFGTVTIMSSNPVSVPDSSSAHQTTFGYQGEGGALIQELWRVVVRGSQIFLLRVQAPPDAWESIADQANTFVDSFTLETPAPFGASRDDSLFQYWGEIVSLDPALSRFGPADLVGAIFSGLVKLDTDLNLVPDIAESWTISDDGTIYTFTLKNNVRFHNGTAVTAADFKYSWERALDPAIHSPVALTYLGDIVGAGDVAEGLTGELSGVEALDDRTIRVTIEAPYPYFLSKLVYPTAYVVDRANVESGEDWTDVPNGTGPFKLKVWQKDQLLILERNEDWYGGTPALAHSVYLIFGGSPFQMYENGEIDIVSLGSFQIDRARDPSSTIHDQLREGTAFCTSYLGFNVTQPPFDDPKVRQALGLALELDKQVEVSRRGLVQRAAGILPPGMPAHNEDLVPFAFDVQTALQLLDDSSYGGAENLPIIRSYASNGAIHWAWREYLGLEEEAVGIFELSDWLDRMDNLELGVFTAGWCADYPDPQNFLDVLFQSESESNNFAYSNPDLDALLEEAAVEQDTARRTDLYQQAEQMILDDWVVVPLWHNREYSLVQTYVKGYEVTPIEVQQLQNLSIERAP